MIIGVPKAFDPNQIGAVASEIMDCLVDPAPIETSLVRWAKHLGVSSDLLITVVKRLEVASASGKMTDAEFANSVLQRLSVRASTQLALSSLMVLNRLRMADLTVCDGVWETIEAIRGSSWTEDRRRFGLISTLSHVNLGAVVKLGFKRPAIDACVFSAEDGLSKPDAVAFQTITKRLYAEPTNCLVLDDHLDYLQTAQKLGMMPVAVLTPRGHAGRNFDISSDFRLDLAAKGIASIDRFDELAEILQL